MKNAYNRTVKKIGLCIILVVIALISIIQKVYAEDKKNYNWTYIVRNGDTLSEIVKRELNMSWYNTNIESVVRRFNPGINVDCIHPGDGITLPEGDIRRRIRLAEEERQRRLAAAEAKAKAKEQERIEIEEYKQKEIGETNRRKDLAENQIRMLEQNIAGLNLEKTQKIESINMVKAQSRETSQRITIGKQQIEELNKVLEKTDEKIEQKNKEIQKLEQELGEKAKK